MKNIQKIFPNFAKKALVFTLILTSVYATFGAGTILATETSVDTKCVFAESLNDTNHQTIGESNELSVANIIANAGLSVSGQKEYQVWESTKANNVIEITFLDGYTDAGDVLGYYKKGDLNSFTPLFKNGVSANSTYPGVGQATPGDKYTVTLPAGEYGFAIHSEYIDIKGFRASENSLNGGSDQMIAYNVFGTENDGLGIYVLGFEDIPLSQSDKDYNDIVVKVAIKSCGEEERENTPPTLTLVGANPLVIFQNDNFTDPGATANDLEDGDITGDIVVTGTVDTNTPGTYTLKYNVTDSEGLSAPEVTRLVKVYSITGEQCAIPDTLGDTTVEEVRPSTRPDIAPSLSTIIDDAGFSVSDQKQYQVWKTNKATTTIEVTFLGGSTIAGNVFGYYEKGNPNTFVPLFVNGGQLGPSYPNPSVNSVYPNAATSTPGQTFIFTVPAGEIAFAIHSDLNGLHFRASENSLNENGGDYMVAYDVFNFNNPNYGLYILGFEDVSLEGISDRDYNDTVVLIKIKNCEDGEAPENTPPAITLLGANPLTIFQHSTFTEPGATANDLEDGDITADIIYGGTVNTSVLGTTTLTYNVTDSEGLSAPEVTRTVVVVPVPENPPLTIVATKIVCESESDLPNWGLGGPDISSSTAKNYVRENSNCHLESGWNFQWSFGGEREKLPAPVLAGDFLGEAVSPEGHSSWNTFGTTDLNGVATTTISELNGASKIWVREVLKEGYIPFTYPQNENNDPVSAELYCHKDVLNYDNYDSISPISTGNTYYCVAWNVKKEIVENTPPVITLVGSNPIDIYINDPFTDPGATANDLEDGDITDDIVVTGTVDNTTLGTYTLTYNVTDSGGLSATPVSRTVNVLNRPTSDKGSITFCLVLGDHNNTIATTSAGLPTGSFSIDLATGKSFGTSTISSKSWNTNTFSPNRMTILSQDDSECMTIEGLEMGEYYYSELSVNGSLWNTPKYSDQHDQTVNNIFDLFLYSPELFNNDPSDDASRNLNSDGHITINAGRKDRTVILYNTYKEAPACVLPSITSAFTASGIVGQEFTYTMTSSSTPATTTLSVATSTLPAWLSFATSTNTLSGTPTSAGEFDITMEALNSCGMDTQTLTITVTNPPTGGPEANLEVVKISDKSTANTGDTITYTITVTNKGADNATGVEVTDTLSSNLTFVSATSTLGSYSTTTGKWIIGSLNNTASTTLTIVVTINGGTEGQTIANTAVVSGNENDPDGSNDSSTVNVSVNNPNPPCTSNCNPNPPCTANCGGGGGGGPITPNNLTIFNESVIETEPGIAFVTWNTNLSATRRVVYGTVSQPAVGSAPNYGYTNSTELVENPLLTAHAMAIAIQSGQTYYFRPISTDIYNGTPRIVIGKEVVLNPGSNPVPNSCYYLFDYLRADFNNNPVEVRKLQVFLRDLEGFTNIQITGVYDEQTIVYLNQFQARYASDILTPWGHTAPTAYTYILTKKKVNEIYCKTAFPVTVQEQAEIDAFRNFLLGLQESGITVPPGGFTVPPQGGNNQVIENDIVGSANNGNSTTSNQGTLAGISSTTVNIAENLFANVISSGRRAMDYIGGWFAWPFGSIFSRTDQCDLDGRVWFDWVNFILILIIAYISYRWYQERKNNKKLDEINKEIDLE